MTHMLPRERAEQILADYAAGKPVRAIARAYRHSGNTVRDYVHGRRTPGEPAARPDGFGPFAAYCRQRLADDPHLRSPALLAEVSRAGFRGATRTFYRALERHRIQPHPCPDCYIARISGAPVTGETLASFLGRLATVNHTSPDALLEFLPPWFRVKTRWHDDRWQHDQLTPWAGDAAARPSPPAPPPPAATAPRPGASRSLSRCTCPHTTRSASGTASGCPDRERRNSASANARTSWPPSGRHAGSSATAPSSS